MYNNLKAEMARHGITSADISKSICVDPSTFSRKIKREDGFKLIEAQKIRDIFFPELPIDYLFKYELQK